MKSRVIFACSVLLLLAFVHIHGFSQKVEWKGTIEETNGIKVVSNPKEPIYGELKYELEKDLRIGNDLDENYLFVRIRGVTVDGHRNIYITDWGNYRIQKFDWTGEYIQTIGRQGEGPGEFHLYMQVLIDDATGEIFVRDGSHQIERFNQDGEFLGLIKLEKLAIDYQLDGKGNFFSIYGTYNESELSKTLCKFTKKGELIADIAKFPHQIYYRRRGEVELLTSFRYAHDFFLSRVDENKLVYGQSGEYELYIIDNDGGLLFKIKKEEPYIKFSSKEKRDYKKRMQFTSLSHKPFFYKLFNDSLGRIYVQRNSFRGDEKEDPEFDVFSNDGYFLYRIKLPRYTMLIKDGYLYEYVMDEEEGGEYIYRQIIKNWDQIKTGIN